MKVIRFVVKIMGIEDDIRKEERSVIANDLINASHWFSSTTVKHRAIAMNALYFCGMLYKESNTICADKLRTKIDKLKYTRYIDNEN